MAWISLVWSLVGGFRGILVAGAVVAAMGAYDRLIDDPGVVRQARAGFVAQAERDALVAQLAERDRQRIAADAALAGLQYDIEQQARNSAAAAERFEREREDYEAQLIESGRACYLDDGDIRWLER